MSHELIFCGCPRSPQDLSPQDLGLHKIWARMNNKIDENTPEMDLKIRIGVHTGSIVAGVIGKNKFAYDLWGAAVNMANRLETTCPPGCIQISEHTPFSFKPVSNGWLCYKNIVIPHLDIKVENTWFLKFIFRFSDIHGLTPLDSTHSGDDF